MNYTVIRIKCPVEQIDLIISRLFEIGFDSFQEFEDGFEGSCDMSVFDENKLNALLAEFSEASYTIKEQEKVNWNEEWEKNYDPIIVGDRCIVRASFHEPRPEFEYEIIVTPKMSFGTGHHATTYQMLDYQMDLDHKSKKVLDVGTGTGLLAIMADKRGAVEITATDIDDWCIENSEENFTLNEVKDVKLIKGQIEEVKESNFDIVIANINKNVLLNQISDYSQVLKYNGELLLSGFYEDDIPDLLQEAEKYHLKEKVRTVKDRWAMLALNKQSV